MEITIGPFTLETSWRHIYLALPAFETFIDWTDWRFATWDWRWCWKVAG